MSDDSCHEPPGQVIPRLTAPCWWCRHPRPAHGQPTGAKRVYIPIYGWLDVDEDHRTRVERFFHVPMLVLALLVLPLLVLEWYYGDDSNSAHWAIRFSILAAGAMIWFAFLVEFIIKIWIAESRVQYVTRNWLDVLIVALPLLRPLRMARAARIVRVSQQVSRVSRVFTLRGVVMKLIRTAAATLVGLGFVRRIRERIRGPSSENAPPQYESWSRPCLIAEIQRLNRQISRLESQIRKSTGRDSSHPADLPPGPPPDQA